MKLAIANIECDGDIQPRAFMDGNIVSQYSDLMEQGVKFPPVVVFDDGETKWLACGFHRIYAAEDAGLETIEAEVRKGTKRDAMLYAVGTNATHGVPRTNADKRRAVETLLRDEEWRKESQGWIAKHACVTQQFVSKVMSESTHNNGESKSPLRKGRDGRTIDTTNIGKRKVPVVSGIEAAKVRLKEAVEAEANDDEPESAPVSNAQTRREALCCPHCGEYLGY